VGVLDLPGIGGDPGLEPPVQGAARQFRRLQKQARREGLITGEYLGHQIDEAGRAGVISKKEAEALRDYHEKVELLLSVDDFASDEIGRATAPTAGGEPPAAETAVPASRKKTSKTKKKTTRKKASKKKSKTAK